MSDLLADLSQPNEAVITVRGHKFRLIEPSYDLLQQLYKASEVEPEDAKKGELSESDTQRLIALIVKHAVYDEAGESQPFEGVGVDEILGWPAGVFTRFQKPLTQMMGWAAEEGNDDQP